MTNAAQQDSAKAPFGALVSFLAIVLIGAAVCFAYGNSLRGEFVFDDFNSVVENQSIRHLWPLSGVLTATQARGATVEGRPVLNLSFAVNYALGGTTTEGYHLANLAIHVLACLVLFGVLRRTFRSVGEPFRGDSTLIACVCTLLWGLHPLQTESVSYVAQRAESLMGLLFLGSLYAAIRTEGSRRPWIWTTASIVAAFLCAGTKEVAVTLPVVVLLYDRTFLSGSFGAALRRRWPLYAGLAASWILLALLVGSSGNRGGTIGAAAGMDPWTYALCQSRALIHYLRLCFWPFPLVADYGTDFVPFAQALPYSLTVIALLAAVAWALVKRPALGFLGAWFFVILAPTSSFVGGTRQMLAEHRMYLSLAAVGVGFAVALYGLLGRKGLFLGTAIATALGFATAERNKTYRDGLSFYRDIVLHRPGNPWAHNNLAMTLRDRGRLPDALVQFQEALRLWPTYSAAHNNLGLALADLPGRQGEARSHYETALRLNPDYAEAHNNLANLLSDQPGEEAEALAHYEKALQIKPGYAHAEYNLAGLLAKLPGRQEEAVAHYEEAIRLEPEFPDAHYNLANLLFAMRGHRDDAILQYEATLRLKPDFSAAHVNLAILLAADPARQAEALAHYGEAIRLKPDSPLAHMNMANLLSRMAGREDEAIAHLETALRLDPENADAHNNLAVILTNRPGREAEALAHYEAALRLKPGSAEAYNNLATLLERVPGGKPDAARNFETALRLLPNSPVIHLNLARLLETVPGRMEEAAVHYRAALRLDPSLAEARQALERIGGQGR